ncbi:MAG: right-handed parallel beta-helix repeat-containing protein [Fimbriimonadaceae bacterium]|nr:right-handed parallel beta-helix repeat-containing protein [Fimbriimonadaceae bacterium]
MSTPTLRWRVVVPAFLSVVGATAQTVFHVAPAGRDSWSGRLPAANAAGTDGPFATPQRAQQAVRDARAAGAVTVELHGGAYELRSPLTLTAADAGTADAPVCWRAAAGERPVLSGGQTIDGLRETTVAGQRRWTALLPAVAAGEWTFRQLFVAAADGPWQRRYRPHRGMWAVDQLTYSPRRQAAPHRAAQKDFHYYAGDLQPFRNLADVELVALHLWSSSRLRIARLDEANQIVEFTGLPTFAIGQVGPHNPYWVENLAEELDEPGEWYLDRPTGTLTYLPLATERLATTRLLAPRLDRVLVLAGNWAQGQFVDHLRFEGLTFSHNESPLPAEGYGGSQAQPDLPAAIEATGARHCLFERCTISQTGNYGLSLGRGCADNRIRGCRLFDLGGGGIKIGDSAMAATAPAPELPTGNTIEQCAISDGGLMYYSANAIWAGIVRGTVIAHNEIWNFPYSGIAVGWNWSDQPTSCAANRIEFNRLHQVVALLADGASIYTLGRQPGTVIRGNVLADNPRGPHAREHWQLGLYLDEGSSEMLVENNLSYGVGTHGFNLNGGAQNVIRNNIFGPVHGDQAPFVRIHAKPYAKANVYERNLHYASSPNLADGVWPLDLLASRRNLYWNTAGQPLRFAGKSWDEWLALGQEVGSVHADPRFVDPAHGDFRLRPDSPALALGFVPFDPGEAGLSPAWRDVAAAVTVTSPPVYAMRPAAIPEPVPGFRLSLEDVPPGMVPRELDLASAVGRPQDVGVVDGVAANGQRSLRLTDVALPARSFLPYLTHTLSRPSTAGTVTLTGRVRLEPGAPCGVSLEFRDYQPASGREFAGGPNVQVSGDGQVSAGGQTLGQLTPGQWLLVSIRFTLGQPAAPPASVVATWPDGAIRQVTVPLAADFRVLSRVMFVGFGNTAGSCYLDDLALSVE